MHEHPLAVGRSFGLSLDEDEDLFAELRRFCQRHQVRQGYLPVIVGGFALAEVVAACGSPADAMAPMGASTVLDHVDVVGAGMLAQDEDSGLTVAHLHVAAGRKLCDATGYTSHLLNARVGLTCELVVVEVTDPAWVRRRSGQYNVPTLSFAPIPA